MEENSEQELGATENWDYERGEIKKPVKSPRVVVSVAFRRDDFVTMSEYAERVGKKTSEFIREAALEKATGRASEAVVHSSGSTGSIWSSLPSTTRVYTLELQRITDTLVVTGA